MKSKKPNVLILYSDQHNARVLGSYGNEEVKTPHLDRLAKEGLRFDRAYTQNPICTPSRMSFLSGQYVHNFGYYGLMGPCPDYLPNLFSFFKEHNYITGLAGKTHTPAGWLSPVTDDLADGFGYEKNRQNWDHDQREGVQGILENDYNDYLKELGLLTERDDKIYHEWYEKHGHNQGQGLDARYSRLAKEHTIEAWSAQRAIQFLERQKTEDSPFFYWLTVPRPHQTYVPAKEFWDLYDEDKLTLPDNANDDLRGRHFTAKRKQSYFQENRDWLSFDPKDFEQARRRILKGYYANVSQVDSAMGEVLDYLEETGLKDNTIILYLSDHGEFAGEHGLVEKAPGIAFHCVTRVPSILAWQEKIKAGTREQLIETVDWFPTLAELCGLSIPEHCDGRSLLPVIFEQEKVHDYVFTENAYTKTVQSERFKYTRYLPAASAGNSKKLNNYSEKAFEEFYDHLKDPGELYNLASLESYSEKEQLRLRALYQEGFIEEQIQLHFEALCNWLIASQRPVTLSPSIATIDGRDGDWDISNEYLAQDAKVQKSFVQKKLDTEELNYF